MVVTDSSLGNVTFSGSAAAPPLDKVYSQSCYYVLLADQELMDGKPGHFNVLDMRSHRIPRVCRSSYAADLEPKKLSTLDSCAGAFLLLFGACPCKGRTWAAA